MLRLQRSPLLLMFLRLKIRLSRVLIPCEILSNIFIISHRFMDNRLKIVFLIMWCIIFFILSYEIQVIHFILLLTCIATSIFGNLLIYMSLYCINDTIHFIIFQERHCPFWRHAMKRLWNNLALAHHIHQFYVIISVLFPWSLFHDLIQWFNPKVQSNPNVAWSDSIVLSFIYNLS